MKHTLTVGIPVYNEENNIAHLIRGILAQNSSNYTLERIVILSDNSTDKTNDLVRKLAEGNPIITLYAYEDRKGKCHRLNQLFEMNESEVLVSFDGDIALSGKNVLEHIVECFDNADVCLVGVNDIPAKATTFQQRVINAWYAIWNTIRIGYNNGQNIYTIHGNALVLRKRFAKKIKYPAGLTADQHYLYLQAKKDGHKYAFAKSAVIYFQTPDSFKEFFLQTTRFLTEKNVLYDIFGAQIKNEYKIPTIYKIKSIFMAFIKDPFYSTLAIMMYTYLSFFFHKGDPLQQQGLWQQARSTKKTFQI